MKSILITFLMFAAVIGAMYFGIFDLLSSTWFMVFAICAVAASLIFAYKVLGNPLAKDGKNDKEQH